MSANDAGGGRSSDFQAAVDRLEKAVQDLAASARNEISGRAASIIEETSSRLERELQGRQDRRQAYRSRRRSRRHRSRDRYARRTTPSRNLYRDRDNARIVGVCAGVANYFGVEHWVIRCAAITGLLFLPGVVFPAYWVMYFVMSEAPSEGAPARDDRGRDRSATDERYSSPAPELGPRWSPRGTLRNVQADLQQAELKLRRIETLVTSGQYELQRELHKLEDDGPNARA